MTALTASHWNVAAFYAIDIPADLPPAEARRLAEELNRRRNARADHATIRKWLLMLSKNVSNPPAEREDFEARLLGIRLACEGLPAECWSDETLGAALRSSPFWPTPADLYRTLETFALRLDRTLEKLEHLADPPPPPEPVAPPVCPNRESTVPYLPGPAPEWAVRRDVGPSLAAAAIRARVGRFRRVGEALSGQDGEPDPDTRNNVERQLAALGYPRDGARPLEPAELDTAYQTTGRPSPRQPQRKVANDH